MINPSPPARVALVTGSAGGIMRGVCVSLARKRFAIVAHYRPERGNADETIAAVRAMGSPCVALGVDVETSHGAAELVAGTLTQFGRLDVLVCGVGPMIVKDAFDMTPDEFAEMVDGNLTSAFLTIKAALTVMREQHFGRIIGFGMTGSETTQ